MKKNKSYLWRKITLCFLMLATTVQGQGIQFFNGSYQGAVEAARRANKILFVEVYLNGCPHCAALAPILEEKKVGDFFNYQFVNFKLEANSEDSKILQQQKGLTYVEFPLFFFFDPRTGQLVHMAFPGERPNKNEAIEEVLKHGKNALDTTERTLAYSSRFSKGDRGLAFLINYAKYVKSMKDMDRLGTINTEIAKVMTKPSDLESKLGFYVLQRLIEDYKNPMAVYFFNNINKYKAKYPAKEVNDTGELILYYTLYGKRAAQMDVSEIVKIRQNMVKLGVAPAVASTRTILKEIEAYFRVKQTDKATARLNEHKKMSSMGLADYAYLVKYFNEHATDNTYVSSLVTWVDAGVKAAKPEEKKSQQVADLYLQRSKAFQRIGKKIEAKKDAQMALSVAQAAKLDTKPFVDELTKLSR
ncbi:thioredoxin family protein [Runella sp. SP2]|uniref:thioredoxin family protein n=1 Tax=Runella sp. SP2 TaxID=2268026 RepID=UPI000F08B0F7|nr:thioredoxin family protein [Runella sp. SP2]AYQ30781.1 thioredoxin family protein [Runella sp. SP2]